MVIRRLSKKDVKESPFLIWNTFVELMVDEEFDSLNDIQRVAYLCFWYDSEVQNGGHLQYFENRELDMLDESILALEMSSVTRLAIWSYINRSKPCRQPWRDDTSVIPRTLFELFLNRNHE